MGRKWNVLRQRVDSCDYDTSQLLVGTILFTILLFLVPTTVVFAGVFFSLRVIQWTVQLLLRAVVVGINWSTFSAYEFLGQMGSDASLLSARVVLVRDGGCEVVWNRRRWSVEEMMAVVERSDVRSVLGDVLGVRRREAPSHPLTTTAGLWTTL